MSQALQGRSILVTRPAAQASGLAAQIRQAGGEPVLYPLLDIQPLPDSALDVAWDALPQTSLAIFISPNAVAHSVVRLRARGAWPAQCRVAAVGQGTARALAEAGFQDVVFPPTQFDSEGLLALPELGAHPMAGRRVLLFKGEGGRDLLGQTLRERGAEVVEVPCYRRHPPAQDPGPVQARLDASELDAVILSSSEAAAHLPAVFRDDQWAKARVIPVFVPHPRIAEAATSLGCACVVQTAAGDAGLMAGLRAYNWP